MFSASPDASIRVWGVQQAQCGQIVRTHEGPVTGLSLHATGDYLLSSSTDGVRSAQKFYFNFNHFFHILCLRVVKNGLQSTSRMSIIILMKLLISIYISFGWLFYPCNPFIYFLMLIPAYPSMYLLDCPTPIVHNHNTENIAQDSNSMNKILNNTHSENDNYDTDLSFFSENELHRCA